MILPVFRYVIPFAFGVLCSLLLAPLARQLAFRVGAVDRPGARRVHRVPTPRFGGIVIYLAMGISLALVSLIDAFVGRLFLHSAETIVLIVAATMILAIGIMDDCGGLGAWIKLLVEILAAAAVTVTGFQIHTIFGISLGWLSLPVSILWIVTVVNGVNLIDGLDGLAAGSSLISSATLFAVSVYLKDVRTALVLAALSGTLLGFLYFNFYPARLFLGDSGTLLIGFLISVIAIQSSSKSATVVAILAPALAIGLPLAEVAATTIRRTLRLLPAEPNQRRERARLGLFTADAEHIHHRLLALGINHRRAVIILYGVCLAFGIVAFTLSYQRIDILLILAGAAAAAGALVPRLEPSNTADGEIARATARHKWLAYVCLDFCLVLASWFAALLYNRSPMGPAIAQINAAGPWLVLAQMTCLIAGGLYRRAPQSYGLRDLLNLLGPIALAAIAGWVVLGIARDWRFPPWGMFSVDSYLLAILICGSRVALRVVEYFVKSRIALQGVESKESVAVEIETSTRRAPRIPGFQ